MWFKGAVRGDEWVMCELCCGREVEKQPPNWESNHYNQTTLTSRCRDFIMN